MSSYVPFLKTPCLVNFSRDVSGRSRSCSRATKARDDIVHKFLPMTSWRRRFLLRKVEFKHCKTKRVTVTLCLVYDGNRVTMIFNGYVVDVRDNVTFLHSMYHCQPSISDIFDSNST
jgi:hypothetical protein